MGVPHDPAPLTPSMRFSPIRRVLNHDRGSAGLVGTVGAQLVKDALLRLSNYSYSVVKVNLPGVGAHRPHGLVKHDCGLA
jgi:hypothetical protein